jgi:hypothetical protein
MRTHPTQEREISQDIQCPLILCMRSMLLYTRPRTPSISYLEIRWQTYYIFTYIHWHFQTWMHSYNQKPAVSSSLLFSSETSRIEAHWHFKAVMNSNNSNSFHFYFDSIVFKLSARNVLCWWTCVSIFFVEGEEHMFHFTTLGIEFVHRSFQKQRRCATHWKSYVDLNRSVRSKDACFSAPKPPRLM